MVTFPTTNVGEGSTLRFTISNLGPTRGLSLGATTIDGPNAADFRTYRITTNGEDNGEFGVDFRPSSPGPKTATLHIVNSDCDENPFDIRLMGTTSGTTQPSRLVNISTRANVGVGDNVLIGGFIIAGTQPKKVIVRAIGPSLAQQQVTGALSDPTLELHGTNGLIASSDDWRTHQAEIQASGLPPTNDLESAIVRTLSPGNYTAIVRGYSGRTGVALVEVYDLDPAATSKLANVSSRAFVHTGDSVMIGGFIIQGGNALNVIVRALGPELIQNGLTSVLLDPTLTLHNGQGTVIATNDNWRDSQQAQIQATGFAPLNNVESGIVQALSPGNYTAIVRGKNGTIGKALVEVYSLN